jgi:hypothetical protein
MITILAFSQSSTFNPIPSSNFNYLVQLMAFIIILRHQKMIKKSPVPKAFSLIVTHSQTVTFSMQSSNLFLSLFNSLRQMKTFLKIVVTTSFDFI